MSISHLFSGGQWQTSFNTTYSQGTSQLTSSPYYYGVTTSWSFSTSWSAVTSIWKTVPFSTSYGTSWSTFQSTYGCVKTSSFIYGGTTAADVKVGDTLLLSDEKTLAPGSGVVSYSKTKLADGWKIKTKNGAELICSSTAPIPTPDGIVTAPNLLGKNVATMIDDVKIWDTVVVCEPIGKIEVQHITVGNKCFWAGENVGKYILHHNVKDGSDYYDTYWATSGTTSHVTSTSYNSYWWTGYSQMTSTSYTTNYYTAGYYTTSWTTSWAVITNRLTGNV